MFTTAEQMSHCLKGLYGTTAGHFGASSANDGSVSNLLSQPVTHGSSGKHLWGPGAGTGQGGE